MTTFSDISIRNRLLAGLLAGIVGGVMFGLLVPAPLGFGFNLVVSAVLGLLFGLTLGRHIRTPGSGLLWGEAFGLFWWLIGSLTLIPLLSGQGLAWTTTAVTQAFPLLLGQVVAFGSVLGLGTYLFIRLLTRMAPPHSHSQPTDGTFKRPMGQAIVPPLVQALIIGGFGGLFGSWLFAQGIEQAQFFPLVAQLMGSSSLVVGEWLHYLIGIVIGITFGLLFHHDVRGTGPGLVWGLSYGLIWWIIGPMTLMPLLLGVETRPDWSLSAAQAAFSALIAHLLYGALVGLFYALANRVWQLLFVDSDPLNRPLEAAGARGLRAILMGQAGGLIGGLLFTVVMAGIGALPDVASLVGGTSIFAGFLVHLIISLIIGSSFGLLFQREAYSYGAGLAWGLAYGVLWWLLGAVTLFSVLLRQPVDWSLAAVTALFPALIGHLLYGIGLGLFFQFLARRYDDTLSGWPQRGAQGTRLTTSNTTSSVPQIAGTATPALWVVTLILGVLLPLLLS